MPTAQAIYTRTSASSKHGIYEAKKLRITKIKINENTAKISKTAYRMTDTLLTYV